MMRRILKYDLATDDTTTVSMPAGAAILDVQSQNGALRMWALVDLNEPHETREFAAIGTGFDVPDSAFYRGTVQFYDGRFVVHVFEIIASLTAPGRDGERVG